MNIIQYFILKKFLASDQSMLGLSLLATWKYKTGRGWAKQLSERESKEHQGKKTQVRSIYFLNNYSKYGWIKWSKEKQ